MEGRKPSTFDDHLAAGAIAREWGVESRFVQADEAGSQPTGTGG